ncbi:unnamed protein product [Strongylus vulgaris]|uniref:Uncharacterized protein n=1 Tax=Strongylus vulgaris TaxID=40348 RepID=A0A3P7ID21_STRVU|nr:unnamed protein product [Strongylus vulgaris]
MPEADDCEKSQARSHVGSRRQNGIGARGQREKNRSSGAQQQPMQPKAQRSHTISKQVLLAYEWPPNLTYPRFSACR